MGNRCLESRMHHPINSFRNPSLDEHRYKNLRKITPCNRSLLRKESSLLKNNPKANLSCQQHWLPSWQSSNHYSIKNYSGIIISEDVRKILKRMLELDPMKRISPYEILKSFGIGCEPIRIPSYWFLLEDYAHQIDININNSNLLNTKMKNQW